MKKGERYLNMYKDNGNIIEQIEALTSVTDNNLSKIVDAIKSDLNKVVFGIDAIVKKSVIPSSKKKEGGNSDNGFDKTEVKFEGLFKNVSEIANSTLITTMLGGADNFVTILVNGFGESLSLASSIVKLIMGIGSLASGGGILSLFGLFDEGGFTGSGGKHEPAGIVHKGEFVINSESTKRYYPLLELINAATPLSISTPLKLSYGYANGGLVTGSMQPVINVVVESEVERTKAIKFYQNTFGDYSARQKKKSL